MALSSLASEQSNLTKQTINNLHQLIYYLGTHPDATIWYYASNMILNFHSDESYLLDRDARTQAAVHLFLRLKPQSKHPIHLNEAVFTLCHILKFSTALAAKAEIRVLFLNAKDAKIMRITLH